MNSPPEGRDASFVAGLTRGLRLRYVSALVAVAALAILHQVVVQPALVRLNLFAPVINVAGRQRMLSQRLTKASLAIRADPTDVDRFDELAETLDTWSRSHHGLRYGSRELDLPETTSPDIVAAFDELQPHFDAMLAAGRHIVDHPDVAADDAGFVRDVETILHHESRYLPVMDHIVGLYEREAREQVAGLQLAGFSIVGAILALLGLVGWFVVQPATSLIGEQFSELAASEKVLRQARDELEERVEERTAQLVEANDQLEREIAERLVAEERSRTLQHQLAHAGRVTAIGELATGLAHELNQPLGAVVNYVETIELLLAESPPDLERTTRAIEAARSSVLRASHIIRRMRRFVQGRRQEPQEVDPNELVAEVVELCTPEARRAEVRIETAFTDVPRVRVDAIGIQQVVVNLVQNAIQAMLKCPRDRRRLLVETSVERERFQVRCIDSGPGFEVDPEEFFEPFITTREEGLGMGLPISRAIVRDHGGDLFSEPAPGGGAIVGFTLPAVRVASREVERVLA